MLNHFLPICFPFQISSPAQMPFVTLADEAIQAHVSSKPDKKRLQRRVNSGRITNAIVGGN